MKGEGESRANVAETSSSVSADDCDGVLTFTESRKGTKKYLNVEYVAQAASKLTTYEVAGTRACNRALCLGLFASVIAPVGGFFASGFKRAFKIKICDGCYD